MHAVHPISEPRSRVKRKVLMGRSNHNNKHICYISHNLIFGVIKWPFLLHGNHQVCIHTSDMRERRRHTKWGFSMATGSTYPGS